MSKLTPQQIEELKKLGTTKITNNGTTQIILDNGGIINISTKGTYWLQGKQNSREATQQLINEVLTPKDGQRTSNEEKQLFIVYGHDHTSRAIRTHSDKTWHQTHKSHQQYGYDDHRSFRK